MRCSCARNIHERLRDWVIIYYRGGFTMQGYYREMKSSLVRCNSCKAKWRYIGGYIKELADRAAYPVSWREFRGDKRYILSAVETKLDTLNKYADDVVGIRVIYHFYEVLSRVSCKTEDPHYLMHLNLAFNGKGIYELCKGLVEKAPYMSLSEDTLKVFEDEYEVLYRSGNKIGIRR